MQLAKVVVPLDAVQLEVGVRSVEVAVVEAVLAALCEDDS